MHSYHTFNNMYDEFIKTIIGFFPQCKRLVFYHSLFTQIKSINHKLPGRLFMSSIASHSDAIFTKDVNYFLNTPGILITKTRERAFIEIAIKENWNRMSEGEREIIWYYLQQLLTICSQIIDDDETYDVDENVEEETGKLILRHFSFDIGRV